MSSYPRIRIQTTILYIGSREQVYPHLDNQMVYIDHPTSTIPPALEWCDKRPLADLNEVIHTVFASENIKGEQQAEWITNLNTVRPIHLHITFEYKNGGWGWRSQLYVFATNHYQPVGSARDSGVWVERTLISACEEFARVLFPMHIDPDLSNED